MRLRCCLWLTSRAHTQDCCCFLIVWSIYGHVRIYVLDVYIINTLFCTCVVRRINHSRNQFRASELEDDSSLIKWWVIANRFAKKIHLKKGFTLKEPIRSRIFSHHYFWSPQLRSPPLSGSGRRERIIKRITALTARAASGVRACSPAPTSSQMRADTRLSRFSRHRFLRIRSFISV